MSTTAQMTAEQKRIACAEEVGWTHTIQANYPKEEWWFPPNEHLNYGKAKVFTDISNFLHDANAALELVAHLAEVGWKFSAHLSSNDEWECYFYRRDLDADAISRATTLPAAIVEAFLRCVGRWTTDRYDHHCTNVRRTNSHRVRD